MSNRTPDKPPYSAGQFVDREPACKLVLDKARRIAAGLVVERRVVIFHGQRGSGKTWLLRELEHRLGASDREGPVTPHYLDLKLNDDPAAIKAGIPEKRPLVLLVDNVNEAAEDFLDALEEWLLAPLAQEDDVLIVLAERGRPHYWPVTEFREKSEEFDLQPFDRPRIEGQVQKQFPGKAVDVDIDKIESLGGGFPWSTYLLAKHLPDETALDLCAELFLQEVDPDLRPYFEALSVLQAFDESRMGPLLQAHPGSSDRDWDYVACRRLRQRLVATTLAHWEDGQRGYVMDEPLRLVLEARLCERNFAQWIDLHCAAYRLYEKWAARYEQSRQWWTQEKSYHEKCLKKAGRAPADCPPHQSLEEEKEDD